MRAIRRMGGALPGRRTGAAAALPVRSPGRRRAPRRCAPGLGQTRTAGPRPRPRARGAANTGPLPARDCGRPLPDAATDRGRALGHPTYAWARGGSGVGNAWLATQRQPARRRGRRAARLAHRAPCGWRHSASPHWAPGGRRRAARGSPPPCGARRRSAPVPARSPARPAPTWGTQRRPAGRRTSRSSRVGPRREPPAYARHPSAPRAARGLAQSRRVGKRMSPTVLDLGAGIGYNTHYSVC
jgi:hypothetical protein